MSRAQTERRIGENITGPRAAEPRQQDRIDPVIFVDRFLGLDDRRISRRRGWIVAASHVHVDVAVTVFREMRLERGERAFGGLIRHEAQIEFRDRLMRQNRFAARAGVAADDSFDVHRRRVGHPLQRLRSN